ncbi:4-deoxy-4-formamido-L-arabinose-phosphoundecaprenol deformylase, partial [Escherichia sp. R-CC3]
GTAWPHDNRCCSANGTLLLLRSPSGLHAWDHHAWQARSSNWDRQTMIDDIARGLRTLEEIIGQPVTCSAAAGWRADQKVIEAKEAFHLRYNSDCR